MAMVTSKVRTIRMLVPLASIAVLGLSAAGCSSPTPAAPVPSVAPVTSSPAAPSMSTVAFGQSHRFGDGVTVTLDPPRAYQPPQGSASVLPDPLLQVHATVANGSPRSYTMTGPSTLDVAATINGQPVEHQAMDNAPALVAPSGTLLPGQTQGFDYVYGLPPQPSDVTITVTDRASLPETVLYQGQTPVVPTPMTTTARPPVTTTAKPTTTTTRPPTTTTKPAPTTTKAPVQEVDSGPGCAGRAMAGARFNPACPEYQGYLDPGGPGRGPTSGEIQHQNGCKAGYIPASEC